MTTYNRFGWKSGKLKAKSIELKDSTVTSSIAGSLTVTKDLTINGDFTFGNAAADDLTVNGDLIIADDQKIHLGTDEDWSIEYDEDGSDEVKITGADMIISDDQKLNFGSDKDAYIYYDETTNDALEINGPANGIWLSGAGGAISANMILLGAGTTGSPATTSTVGKSFMEFRTQSTATSGDSRCLYMRHNLNGAGVSGESLRSFSKITAAAATCRGAHISLDVASAGSCSGLGVGVDNQILVHDGALSGGTYAVGNFEIYSAGSSTDISGVTEMSFMRIVAGGDGTGASNVDANAFLMSFSGTTDGSGNVVNTDITTHTAYAGIPIKTSAGTKYIAVVND